MRSFAKRPAVDPTLVQASPTPSWKTSQIQPAHFNNPSTRAGSGQVVLANQTIDHATTLNNIDWAVRQLTNLAAKATVQP